MMMKKTKLNAPQLSAPEVPAKEDIWKMSGRHGVAYVCDLALAGELLQTDPKKVAQAAMATYYDRKGRAFAWQIRFDTQRWTEIEKRVGQAVESSR